MDPTEIDSIEAEVDSAFSRTPLPNVGLGLAQWYVSTVIEDMLRLPFAAPSPELVDSQRLVALLDRRKYTFKNALSALRTRLPKDDLAAGRPRINREMYQKTARLLTVCDDYQAAICGFSSLRARRAHLTIEGNGKILKFEMDPERGRYQAMDLCCAMLKENNPSPLFSFHSWCHSDRYWPKALFGIQLRTRNLKDAVDYEYKNTLAERLSGSIPKGLNLIPDAWKSRYGSGSEIRRFFYWLQVRCIYHAIAIIVGSEHSIGLGLQSAAMIIREESLCQQICSLSGLIAEQCSELLSLIRYGNGTNYPDPALQPLIPIRNGEFLISPMTVASSDMQRNFLALLARIDSTEFDRTSSTFESAMIDELVRPLSARWIVRGRYNIPTGRDLGDVDVLIVDPTSKVILVAELRWMLPPAELREVYNRESALDHKALQAERKTAGVRDRIRLVLEDVGISNEDHTSWSIDPLVIIENFSGRSDGKVPTINSDVFRLGIKMFNRLHALYQWILSEEWLPRRGIDFEVEDFTYAIGAYSISYPGITLTKDGLELYRRFEDCK